MAEAKVKDGLMDSSDEFAPKRLGTEFDVILIGNDKQAPNNECDKDLAQDTSEVVRHQMVELEGLFEPTEDDFNGPAIVIEQADLGNGRIDHAGDEGDLLSCREPDAHPAVKQRVVLAQVHQSIIADRVAVGQGLGRTAAVPAQSGA